MSVYGRKERMRIDYGRKRKIDNKALLRLAIFLCIITIMLATTSSFFKIKEVAVEGNSSIPDGEVLKLLSRYMDKNTFMVKPALISEEIKQVLPVEEAKVKLRLPGTIIVRVKEREVMAAIPYLGGFVLIDPACYVVKMQADLDGLRIPIVTGIEITKPEKAKPIIVNKRQDVVEGLKKALKYLLPMRAELSEIHLDNKEGEITFFIYTLDGFQIYLKEKDLEEEKFLLMESVLKDLRERGIDKGQIDLSKGAPVFKAF